MSLGGPRGDPKMDEKAGRTLRLGSGSDPAGAGSRDKKVSAYAFETLPSRACPQDDVS